MTWHPCPVCNGRGHWSRETYKPCEQPPGHVHTADTSRIHRCPFCEGSGRMPPPVGVPS